jgi:hypothetical protein
VTDLLTASNATGQLVFRTRPWGLGAVRIWFGDYAWAFGSAGLLCLFESGIVIQVARGEGTQP